MKDSTKHRLAPGTLALAACFCVFLLPFLLPPKPLQGISAANVAGFNNKVATVGLALASLASLLYFYRRDSSACRDSVDVRRLPRVLVLTMILLLCGLLAAISGMLIRSEELYPADLDYFVNRLTAHTHFGRTLYTEIEFPYGPLLFYLPLLVQKLLFPLHLSLRPAYMVGLNGLYVLGLALLAYVINALRMARSWKMFAFVGLGLQTIQLNFGYNYTLYRFLIPFACLVFAIRRQKTGSIALAVALGEILCLATSPEMGFAFLAGSTAYAAYRLLSERSPRLWFLALTPLAAALLFFGVSTWISGGGYLRMLGMFSRGIYNLVVEPVPYMLVFLFVVAGLVPWFMAHELRARTQSAPLTCALYIASIALLPVALGRCDPDHVLLNGICLYLLSFVAISSARRGRQIAWAVATGFCFLFTVLYTGRGILFPLKVNLVSAMKRTPGLDHAAAVLAHHSSMGWTKLMLSPQKDESIDIGTLTALTGGERVVTPVTTSRVVQDQLYRAGLLTPTFYYFQVAVIDQLSEEHQVAEFNESRWSVIPTDMSMELTEALDNQPIGLQFKYRPRRVPHVTGLLFEHNLRENWRPVTTMNGYVLYQRR